MGSRTTDRILINGAIGPRHPSGLLGGACAEIGSRLGIPVWLVRIAFVLALTKLFWPTAILYAVLSFGLRTRLAGLLPGRAPVARQPRDVPQGPLYDAARDRFASMELRLARIEAAVTSDELRLRRGFRDIGG